MLIMVHTKKAEALSDFLRLFLLILLRAGFLAECEQVALCQVVVEEILMWSQNYRLCCSTSQYVVPCQRADGCAGCVVGCLHGKKGGAPNDFSSHHHCHHTHHHSHYHC